MNSRSTTVRGTFILAVWLVAAWLASGALWAAWPEAVQADIPLADAPRADITDPATVVGADGSLYLAGTFRGPATFGGGVELQSTLDSFDVYVAKYNSVGDLQWAIKGGGPGDETVAGLEIHSSGDVLVTGTFESVAGFGNATLGHEAIQAADIYLARVKDNGDGGEWLWAVGWGTSRFGAVGGSDVSGDDSPSDLAIDELGNRAWVIGTVSGTLGFQDGDACTEEVASVILGFPLDGSAPDGPLWPDGIFAWDTGLPPDGACTVTDNFSFGEAIAARNGKLFASGRRAIGGPLETYIIKYDFDLGQTPQWRRTARTNTFPTNGYLSLDLIVDDDNNVYVAGLARIPGASCWAMKFRDNLSSASEIWDTGDLLIAQGFEQLALPDGSNELFAVGTWDPGGGPEARVFSIDRGSGSVDQIAVTVGGGAFGRSIATDGGFRLYVGGQLGGTVAFGNESLTSPMGVAIPYLAQLDVDGNWAEFFEFEVGQPIVRPAAAVAGVKPTPEAVELRTSEGDYFYWDGTDYYPVQAIPGTFRLLWEATGGGQREKIGIAVWPDDPQLHAAGADVDLDSAGYSYQELHYSDGDLSTDDAGVFRRDVPGFSTLRYLDASSATAFEVVETVDFDGLGPATTSDVDIGTEIVLPGHDRADNAFVAAARAPIDAFGPERAFDRASRTGQILPVNVNGAVFDETLALVGYRTNAKGVRWPDQPYLFQPVWPATPKKIVIKDQTGSEGNSQPALDPTVFVSPRLYVQGDPDQPGYNPNDEHALLAPSRLGTGFPAVFALRQQATTASQPYALLKYRDPDDDLRWKLEVYQVLASGTGDFNFDVEAGGPIPAPYPLELLGDCPETSAVNVSGTPYFEDVRGGVHARANGEMDVTYFYPLQSGFYYDPDLTGGDTGFPGLCVRFVDEAVRYRVDWPANAPTLFAGETLIEPKRGLPDILHQAAVEVAFQGSDEGLDHTLPSLEETDPVAMVKLFDALSPRWVDVTSTFPVSVLDQAPFYLKVRLEHDPVSVPNRLAFKGYFDNSLLGEPLLLINVMSTREKELLLSLSNDPEWQDAIGALYDLSRDPLDLSAIDGALTIGLQDDNGTLEGRELLGAQGVLSAGAARATGYVTLVFNNDESLDPGALPISLEVVRVDCAAGGALYQGAVHTMPTDNVFDERLTLRHSSDFGGEPERYSFDWYYQLDAGGPPADVPPGVAWLDLPEGAAQQIDVTLQGANERTISDSWVFVRYQDTDSAAVCGQSPFTGDPSSTPADPAPKLAEGWIKRVIRGLDPFRARTADFHASAAATYASMIEQAGEPYAGPVAFNGDAANVNQLGLIETYETVLRRGIELSIAGGLDVEAANTPLLLAAGRVADFDMLLGNEAWADAQDPTIGFGTQSGVYGTLATSIFAFQNQLPDLLEEELALLRGRDDSSAAVNLFPVFNRLIWNIDTGDTGEAAYSQVYNIRDRNADGFIDAADARIQYPQGHGDAWGFYTSALTSYYRLLRDPSYTWQPRAEAVNVAGTAVTVDYRDERKFAAAAAARARTGAEIAALTYRQAYVEDPAGQWQGYKDPDPDRAWGLAGWTQRAGQGAYFDWVTANALLPSEWQKPGAVDCPLGDDLEPFLGDDCILVPDAASFPEVGKIDRAGVPELSEITEHYGEIQSILDRADAGLNPLGLARGVVPFDIDPSFLEVGSGVQGLTHFEQIEERARQALAGAVTVFNHANQLTQTLRRNQDTLTDFSRNVDGRERDLRNRLVEIFGYPYADDIGGSGTYPPGYDDADLYHYMVVDPSELIGEPPGPTETVTAFFSQIEGLGFFPDPDIEIQAPTITVEYAYDPAGIGIVKPATWTGSRKAPGDIQRALSEYYQAVNAYDQALAAYDALLDDIEGAVGVLEAQEDLNADQISYLGLGRVNELQRKIYESRITQLTLARAAETAKDNAEAQAEALPTTTGTSTDTTSVARSSLLVVGNELKAVFGAGADAAEGQELRYELALEEANARTDLRLTTINGRFEVVQRVEALQQLIRREPGLRLEAFNRREAIRQALGNYQQTLARGLRLIDELAAFRARTAADVQQYRYQDLAFRVARNDALQKYRAQFDLAARYIYLAATAYDYETNLLGTAGGAGRDFLTDIVRHRSLGEVIDGEPQAGSRGLADPLARLGLNFDVLKGQLGFNNPQTETTRFSLRSELLRIDADSDEEWRSELEKWRVDNLWDLPEFRRFARPFAPQPSGPCTAVDRSGCEPALVIGLETQGGQPLATQVVAGLNYFGQELGAGDSAYDTTNFATRIRTVGLWLTGYELAGLSATPTAYVMPVGEDVLSSPTAGDFTTRQWAVVDQVLPVPFPIGANSLDDPLYIPINDSLSGVSGQLGDVRRYPSLRAFPDTGAFEPSETTTNSRLIGRSVWNTRWLIIIPGRTLLNDPDEGLDRFIANVRDIKLFFQTYAYSGN